MTNHENESATSSVEFVSQEFIPYHTDEQGFSLKEGKIAVKFSGADFTGTGSARSLLALSEDGSGHFGNLIHITGRIGGRSGTFVVQGKGWLKWIDSAAGGWSEVKAEWLIVPGSGTGELTGLRGGGPIHDSGQGAEVTLNYWFE
ncbi:MAG: DUF3224 domain-containing protein [Kutzneria sp.]|nr:DUF3224 domain-containing protein [Kutzneria sp.]